MQLDSVTIGGIEYVNDTLMDSLEISKDMGGRTATASVSVQRANFAIVGNCKVGQFKVGQVPRAQQEIIIKSGATKHFGGHVAQIRRTKISSTVLRFDLGCQDYTRLLDTAIIESATFTSQTDESILDTIFSTYLPAISTTLVNNLKTIDSLQLRDVTVRQAVEKVAERSGGEWYIDFDKKLRHYDPSTNLASFSLHETPDLVNSFPISRASQMQIDFSNPANQVRVLGKAGTITEAQPTFNPGAGSDDGWTSKRESGVWPPTVFFADDTTSADFFPVISFSSPLYQLTVALVKFDTSSIPDTATIVSATLKLFCDSTTFHVADDPQFGIEYYAASNWPIGTGDWTSTPSNNAFGYLPVANITPTASNSFALKSPDANISKTGSTGFRLHLKTASGGAPTGVTNAKFQTFEGTTKPVLEVAWEETTPDITATYNDTASQTTYGVHKRTIIERNILTSGEALLRATVEGLTYANPRESATVVFTKDGADIGQRISITSPKFGLVGDYVIRRMSIRQQKNNRTEYTCEVGDFLPDLESFLRKVSS